MEKLTPIEFCNRLCKEDNPYCVGKLDSDEICKLRRAECTQIKEYLEGDKNE